MSRRKTNKLWLLPKDSLLKVVESSNSLSQILLSLGLSNKGTTNYQRLKKRLDEECIDFSHIKLGVDSNKGRKFDSKNKLSLDEILVDGSDYPRHSLKKRLLKEGLLENKCYECNQTPEWNGKKLVMVLDHINGKSDDNRLGNLRMLCPNCNSQQPTFSRKNK
jgi:hypothetical protein